MKRIYNEYLASPIHNDPIIKTFNDLCEECSKKIVTYANENDLDLRDACSFAESTISCEFADAIIRRACKMREKNNS